MIALSRADLCREGALSDVGHRFWLFRLLAVAALLGALIGDE